MTNPLHNKARHFRELFADLSSFAELETRIRALPTEQDRGNAFEVFAEAYFATRAITQARKVWPESAIPPSIKDRFLLPLKDMGVDGLFETTLGEYHAYQVKFRSQRASLTWGEVSTFMGLSDKVNQRVLFTNSNELPLVIDGRTGFYCIRGADLDRLEESDLKAIQRWLEGDVVRAEPKKPKPHQQEALAAILAGLQQHDRVTTVMACGSGKTLVELWAAERMECRSVLVLVPSLALIRQTLHAWLRETRWPSFSYLCVCSDPTVTKGSDDLAVNQSDLDFPVTTDSESVRRFLSRPFDGVRVVFSTYQSAEVVAEGAAGLATFEFGVFDEAHKTAGREGASFSFALNDKNLQIKKRLFLTATPRHYDVRHKDKDGDTRLVYSMDAPDVYGPVAYTLTFGDAARRNIICGYKVLISVVTSDMVSEHYLRHGEVVVNGDVVKARQVANQIAIQKAVEQYGVSKIFTFHSSVASAKSFVASSSEGIGEHLPKFRSFHVNGEMRTAERDALMQEFGDASDALMSNARCLTEGVDVPAVDMVAFMAPKKSRVDIVQAIGRAMRKSEETGKTTGYVLVPVYLEQANGETVEDAVARSDFADLWDVLEAMQEQDGVLADVIRTMREDRGRTGGFDDQWLRERIEVLGPTVELDTLRKAITAECVEQLGITWDERFGELRRYKERSGDCDVPQRWSENPRLGIWVANQRKDKKTGSLREDRIVRLNEIGFVWDSLEASWERMFAAMLEYRRRHEDCDVPLGWSENPALGIWVATQRKARNAGGISQERVTRLNEIGFSWNTLESRWEDLFAELVKFKNTHGHCDVPAKWCENTQLASWVTNQRSLKAIGKIGQERSAKLDDIGFVWNQFDAKWETMFASLAEYKKEHGDCNVSDQCPENPKLAAWVGTQRLERKKRRLDEEKIARLDDIDFVWSILDETWDRMFEALAEYKRAHGHWNVPDNWPENPQLRRWLNKQREDHKAERISQERIAQLNDIGFVWSPYDTAWETKFAMLEDFRHRHGHCDVPDRYPDNPQLGTWVAGQRKAKKKRQLNNEQVTRLEGIGFKWDLLEADWETKFAALVEYKESHGDCNVPTAWPENPQLARWVRIQRVTKRDETLNEDRLQKLNEIGFVWDPFEAAWEEMFAVLLEYKNTHGNCNVPQKWPSNRSLGKWVSDQRKKCREEKLSSERMDRLNKVGFVWRRQ